MDESTFKLDERVLCSDDACIGLVGPDGNCKECGLAYTGAESLDRTAGDDDSPDQPSDETYRAETTSEDPGESSDPDERVCCPDDACIGIIGDAGKCGTCGKSGP